MKKVITIFILLLVSMLVHAQGSGSGLIVSSGGETFTLFLNSKQVNNPPATLVRAGNLQVGKNRVRISFVKKGIPELTAEVILPNDGYDHELTYRIVATSKGPYKFERVGDLTLQPVGAAEADRSTGQSGKEKSGNGDDEDEGEEQATMSMNTTESGDVTFQVKGNKTNTNVSVGVNSGNVSTSSNQSVTIAAAHSATAPAVANGLMCPRHNTNTQAYLKLKYNASTDLLGSVTSMEVKKFMDNNCMLSAEVADLISIIKNQNVQIDLAQYGYLHTYDQANYGLVVNALTNEIHKEQLLKFMGVNSKALTERVTITENVTSNQSSSTVVVTQTTPEVAPTTTTSVSTSTSTWSSGSSGNCSPMGDDDFEEALAAADDPISEETKMQVAREVFAQECLNTSQIMQVMEIFISENKKLDFAKYAYKRCSEKDKYFRLNKLFISEIKVRELTEYVKSQR